MNSLVEEEGSLIPSSLLARKSESNAPLKNPVPAAAAAKCAEPISLVLECLLDTSA